MCVSSKWGKRRCNVILLKLPPEKLGYLYWRWSSAAPSQQPRGRAASPAGTGSSAFPSLFPDKPSDKFNRPGWFDSWLICSSFPLGDGVPQRSFLYPLLLPLPRPLRSSADTGQSFRTLYLEDFVFSNFIIGLEGTFAIMSAYAIYNGSSSRWLKRRKFQVIIIYYKRALGTSVSSSLLSGVTLTSSLSERCDWSEV